MLANLFFNSLILPVSSSKNIVVFKFSLTATGVPSLSFLFSNNFSATFEPIYPTLLFVSLVTLASLKILSFCGVLLLKEYSE